MANGTTSWKEYVDFRLDIVASRDSGMKYKELAKKYSRCVGYLQLLYRQGKWIEEEFKRDDSLDKIVYEKCGHLPNAQLTTLHNYLYRGGIKPVTVSALREITIEEASSIYGIGVKHLAILKEIKEAIK